MKRLYRIGFNTFISSIIPIISWFLLGLTLDGNLMNVFCLTYPIGFISAILLAIFGTGANISEYKDNEKDGVFSEIIICFVIAIIFATINIVFIDEYLAFMHVDAATYKIFSIYSIISIYIRLMFSLILEKMYFEEKERQATYLTIGFNGINFAFLIGLSLITKNYILITTLTLVASGLYTLVLIALQFKKFKFSFNIIGNLKYQSQNVCIYLLLFLTYFFGLSNAFTYGYAYMTAINFVTLIIDSQWDACSAMTTAANIDIINQEYDIKKTMKNCHLYILTLLTSSIIAFFSLYSVYGVNLKLGLIYLSFEAFTMLISSTYYAFQPVCQIEYSPLINTIIILIGESIRTVFAMTIPSAFCTQLGQVACNIFLLIALQTINFKHFTTNKKGYLVRKKIKKQLKNINKKA